MAAIKELQKTSLSLRLEVGTDDDGNTLYSSKTFSNLKKDVSATAIYAVAEGFKGVLKHNVDSYYINESSLLQNQ